MKRFLAALLWLLPVSSWASPAAPPKLDCGILLLAHGGDKDWDAEIAKLRAKVDARVPSEVALGMADPASLQAGLDRLAARGVSCVVAVPLFVHSRSEVLDQTRYTLGLSDHPSEVLRAAAERMMAAHRAQMGHMAHIKESAGEADPMAAMQHHLFSLERVKTKLRIVLTPALDDAPLVSKILLERARALSRDPKKETVVLVAHGPVDDAAVGAWNTTLAHHADFLRSEGGFRAAAFAVLRDDAAPDVRAKAVEALRARVAEGAKAGRAIVVPVLIARGGIEGKLPRDLQGLDYAWDGKTLMPHDGFDAWVLDRFAAQTWR